MAYAQQSPDAKKGTRAYQEQIITGSRGSLLALLLFSVINLVMLVLDTGRYFLFSASIPYYMTWFGKILDNGTSDGSGSLVSTYTLTALAISAVILAIYLVAWLLSKKRNVWLTVSGILFIVDTAALAVFAFTMLEEPMSCLLDFLFHGIVLWQLFRGIIAAGKLKKMPEETAPAAQTAYQNTNPDLDA